jgi:hypothetical protein
MVKIVMQQLVTRQQEEPLEVFSHVYMCVEIICVIIGVYFSAG